MRTLFAALSILLLAGSCTVSKYRYHPAKKFSPQELQQDYELFRNILEESHPSLYWYTPKDSADYYFKIGESRLQDSLPEYKFRNVLSYVLAQIHCGHTSVRASKAAAKYSQRTRGLMFPLNVKAWPDTVVVTSNLSRRYSNIIRGVVLKSIDNRPVSVIVDSMFQHISADGYNTTHKYQTISNSGAFRNLYAYLYGLKLKTPVEYIDTSGVLRKTEISLGTLVPDSIRIRRSEQHKIKKKRTEEDHPAIHPKHDD